MQKQGNNNKTRSELVIECFIVGTCFIYFVLVTKQNCILTYNSNSWEQGKSIVVIRGRGPPVKQDMYLKRWKQHPTGRKHRVHASLWHMLQDTFVCWHLFICSHALTWVFTRWTVETETNNLQTCHGILWCINPPQTGSGGRVSQIYFYLSLLLPLFMLYSKNGPPAHNLGETNSIIFIWHFESVLPMILPFVTPHSRNTCCRSF